MSVRFNNEAKLQQLRHAEAAARDPCKRKWKKKSNLLMLSEVALVRYMSLAFGRNLPVDVAP